MPKIVNTRSGKRIVLRNPAEKASRYASQLKSGFVKETNEVLTKEQRAYRKGYLGARSDNAKAYCAKKGIKSKSKFHRRFARNKKNK